MKGVLNRMDYQITFSSFHNFMVAAAFFNMLIAAFIMLQWLLFLLFKQKINKIPCRNCNKQFNRNDRNNVMITYRIRKQNRNSLIRSGQIYCKQGSSRYFTSYIQCACNIIISSLRYN